MKIDELKKKTKTELEATLRDLAAEREKVTKDILQNKEKNVKKLGVIRKDIARVKTLLNMRKTEDASGSKEDSSIGKDNK